MKFTLIAIGFILGATAMAMFFQPSDAKPVMVVDFGTQKCLQVDGDAAKCSLYDKSDVIVVNNAF